MVDGSNAGDHHRIVVVGCGADKLNEPAPARDLYKSTYFRKKREYAETIGDSWAILSAEYGVVHPDEELNPYETTITDLSESEVDGWVDRVGFDLEEMAAFALADGADLVTIEILAGLDYIDPLRSILTIWSDNDGPVTVRFPFDNMGGIVDQMPWLNGRVTAAQHDAGAVAGGETE